MKKSTSRQQSRQRHRAAAQAPKREDKGHMQEHEQEHEQLLTSSDFRDESARWVGVLDVAYTYGTGVTTDGRYVNLRTSDRDGKIQE